MSRVEKYFKYQEISDEQKVALASFHLEGDANQWVMWLEEEFEQSDSAVSGTAKEEVSDIAKATADEIKKHAVAVTLTRFSIIPTSHGFTRQETDFVKALRAANLSVLVTTLNNEYLSLAFDFNKDATYTVTR
ncbi:unnamed protein product [Linum tenue]|uniref:glycerophosphodiester phosphodiesterase n=1 Tax=Linum tenue TaxID=586396 RepID=A0AAV0IBP6_9ROSI|nr:unnamed protein product [Linum tenue]